MLTLQTIAPSDRDWLWNVFQKYYYEMSAYYDLEMDDQGQYPYRYFDAYFEESRREALSIRDGETPVGFVLINDYSCLGERIDYAIAEFTIFPRYRKKGYAREAVRQIFRSRPGRWEIKLSEKNGPARAFWFSAAEEYAPHATALEGGETALSFPVE